MHIPSLDICALCEIIKGEKSSANPEKATRDPLAEETIAFRKKASIVEERQRKLEFDTDTVIVGNGPAGISLSAILSGWHPFYDGSHRPHPNAQVHAQLCAAGGKSLLFHDLATAASLNLSEEEQQQAAISLTPFSLLYDSLARPSSSEEEEEKDNNFGPTTKIMENEGDEQISAKTTTTKTSPSFSSSPLFWRHLPAEEVPHIVLGNTPIGGSWNGYNDKMVAVSICNWMDLPGYSLVKDFLGHPGFATLRPTARTFRDYMNDYCRVMGIERNFRPNTQVVQIKKLCDFQNNDYWEVSGVNTLNGQAFFLRCRNVVLACGRNRQRLLGVPGELKNNNKNKNNSPSSSPGSIVYDLNALKRRIDATKNEEEEEERNTTKDDNVDANANYSSSPILPPLSHCPVVVVGDGISAADSILCALEQGCRVLHVIRRSDRQLRNLMLSRLSTRVYPEYSRVFNLMTGKQQQQQNGEANYTKLTDTTVLNMVGGDQIEMRTPGGIVKKRFRCLAVCIGRRSELPLLEGVTTAAADEESADEISSLPLENYRSTSARSLFFIGSLAGDHFVRYLVGGALCTAQSLVCAYRDHPLKQNSMTGALACCDGDPQSAIATATAIRKTNRTRRCRPIFSKSAELRFDEN